MRLEAIDALAKAKLAVKLAEEKNAEDAVILDIGKVSNICDYFVILSASSSKRAQTIALAIEDGFAKQKIRILHSEGYGECVWILLDTQDIIIHIFSSDMRQFYDLERLWSQAIRMDPQDK